MHKNEIIVVKQLIIGADDGPNMYANASIFTDDVNTLQYTN